MDQFFYEIGPIPLVAEAAQTDELSIALVGCGWFALRTHCVTLNKAKARVAAVCARTEPSRQRALNKLGGAGKEFADVAYAINAASCALVALPASVASRACLTAISTGKDLISEKPAAWTPEEAEDLRMAWDERPRPDQRWRVLENWALKPAVLRVGELLDAGCGAQTYAWRCTRRRAQKGDWRRGDAAKELLDVLVHLVRALRCWFGDCKVTSASLRTYDFGGARAVELSLKHEGAGGEIVLELFDGEGEEESVFTCGDITWDADARTVNGDIMEGDGWVSGGAKACLSEALQSVEHGRGDPCTAWEEGLRDCAVCFAALGMGDIRPGAFYELPVVIGTVPRSHEGCVLCLEQAPDLVVLGGGANLRRQRGPFLETRLMNRVVSVKGDIVVVEAGCCLRGLRKALAVRNLTLASWPYYLDSTVGAAVATRSHGTSAKYGTMADFVVACRITTAPTDGWSGDIAGKEPFTYDVKGVLTVVALRCVPLTKVVRSVLTTSSVDAGWLRNVGAHDHAWVWWDVSKGSAAAVMLDESDAGEVYDGRNWTPYPAEVTRLLGPPVAAEDCYTAQYAVAAAAAKAAVAALKRVAGAGVVEVKFLPPSSMLPGAAAMCFNVYVAAPAPPWVLGVERALAALGGVAHPGKCCAVLE
jgi:predicted dehydrogenase